MARDCRELDVARYSVRTCQGHQPVVCRAQCVTKISIIIPKVTDDFLWSGTIQNITQFTEKLCNRSTVGNVILNELLLIHRCELKQDSTGNIRMTINTYMQRIKSIHMDRSTNKKRSESATRDENLPYRSLTGTLMYIRSVVLPQAAYEASNMHQKLRFLRVQHLVDANNMVKELLSLKPYLTYVKRTEVPNVLQSTFSDASHHHDNCYGQTRLVSGLRITQQHKPDLYHLIDCSSEKQRRISYSAFGAAILAAEKGDDRVSYIKMGMESLFPEMALSQEVLVGS